MPKSDNGRAEIRDFSHRCYVGNLVAAILESVQSQFELANSDKSKETPRLASLGHLYSLYVSGQDKRKNLSGIPKLDSGDI